MPKSRIIKIKKNSIFFPFILATKFFIRNIANKRINLQFSINIRGFHKPPRVIYMAIRSFPNYSFFCVFRYIGRAAKLINIWMKRERMETTRMREVLMPKIPKKVT